MTSAVEDVSLEEFLQKGIVRLLQLHMYYEEMNWFYFGVIAK